MLLLIKINLDCPLDDDALITELESLEDEIEKHRKTKRYIRYKKERDFF